jgi:hypothetical protein
MKASVTFSSSSLPFLLVIIQAFIGIQAFIDSLRRAGSCWIAALFRLTTS